MKMCTYASVGLTYITVGTQGPFCTCQIFYHTQECLGTDQEGPGFSQGPWESRFILWSQDFLKLWEVQVPVPPAAVVTCE